MSGDFFSHPETMKHMLAEFLPEGWLPQVDFDSLQRVTFNTPSRRRPPRHNDIVWRLRVRGEWLYVCVLFRFAVPDRWMALRVWVRVGLLFQKLAIEHRLLPGGKFPPVMPVVIYSDDRQWVAMPDLHYLTPPATSVAFAAGPAELS